MTFLDLNFYSVWNCITEEKPSKDLKFFGLLVKR